MKVFISTVSFQFLDVRLALSSDLRAVKHVVEVQEDFQLGGYSLLEKLEESVDSSDKVIALVGDSYGAEPPEAARPPGRPRRSYTQWEYYFALGERLDGSKAKPKPIYVYFADEAYLKDHPHDPKQTPEQTELQRQFIQEIRDSGKHRNSFDSLDKVCRLALRDGFQVRDPGPTSKPRNLPFGTLGSLFKGRAEFLDDLRQRLIGPASGPVAIVAKQAIHGLGGVGKTRVALEYAWKYQDDYSALLFISAPDSASLRSNLANLIGVLAVDGDAPFSPNEEIRLAEVLRWLHNNPRWLLILDNVDTPEAAKEAHALLAKLSGGDLLITSRISKWPSGVVPLELHVLAESAAVDYLLERTPGRRTKPDDKITAAAIAHDLDCLALALEQAGAYIDTLGLSFAEYRARWEQSRLKVLEWHDADVMTYPSSVAATWLTTFERLKEPERQLLQILARLAPEPIPLTFFEAKPLQAAFEDPRQTLAGLTRYSLVRKASEGEAVEIHRLVQEVVRGRASEEEKDESLRIAVESLNDLVPFETDDVRTWPVWLPLALHADVVVWEADRAKIPDPTARLMGQHALFLNTKGQFAKAEPLYRRALAITEASFGADHPRVAIDLNNLAQLLQATNRLVEAEPLMRHALAIDEASLGADHPDVAIDLNNLARLLQATNRLTEAEPLMRRALSIDEASLGADHPNVARDLNNLAQLLQATNRLVEAEPLMRRALTIDEASFGADHPNVAIDLNNLAQLLQATNRLVESEPLMRRALTIDEASFGADHPDVAIDLNNLATLLKATNRLTEAEPLMRRALTIDEASFGADHPNVARHLNNLAQLLQATNRLAEAEPLMRRALAIFVRSLGQEHPNSQVVSNNYRLLLADLKIDEREIDQRIASVFEEAANPNP